ncbi:MAG TPA: tail fiber domain-containing protein, partial [Paludibacter sp.]
GTFYGPPTELTNPNVQYAGYFVGNVKMTGEIWAASGTITGSDERNKKDISVLDASDNLYKLLPKQYKLKTPSELLSEQKPVSDTAKVVIDNIAITEGDNKLHYGFLAQELQLVYPDLVYTSSDGTLGIDYQGLIPMIIDQLQKMKQTLQEKDNRILALEEGLEKCCGLSNLKSASIPTGTTLLETNARLNQNIPNPFSRETRIDCFIPETSGNSVIYIYNMNGTQLQQYGINGKGEQSVTISGNTLEPGMYLYALIVDGKEIDTKRMILTK